MRLENVMRESRISPSLRSFYWCGKKFRRNETVVTIGTHCLALEKNDDKIFIG